MIYLDNAATTYWKPAEVINAVKSAVVSANPGRSGHRLSADAARTVFKAREAAARFFGASAADRVIFTKNATEGLNIAIHGLLGAGGHAVISPLEHNAVMRPLDFLSKRANVGTSSYRITPDGSLDLAHLKKILRKNTKAVIASLVSNVTGQILPTAELADFCKARGIPLIVDAAQAAGALPIDVEKGGFSALALSAHKHMFGPQGVGLLILSPRLDLPPLMQGGTGSRSESEIQPDFPPDSFESGTPNTPGVAGLAAAIRFVEKTGLDIIRKKELALTKRLLDSLMEIRRVRIIGPESEHNRTGTVSIRLTGVDCGRAARTLDEKFGVMCRSGLHCAPAAHKYLGTFPEGTLRLSLTWKNTSAEIDGAVRAIYAVLKNQ